MLDHDASIPLSDKRHVPFTHLSTSEDPQQSSRLSQSTMAGSSKMALQTFSIENDILEIPPQDEIYRFDEAANKKINRESPWAQECVPFSI